MKNLEFRLRSAIAAVGLTAVLATSQGFAESQPHAVAAAAGVIPSEPQSLVLDREGMWRDSKVGQDISRQENALAQTIQKEFGAQDDALQKESQALQKETPGLPPAVRVKRIAAFRAEEANFQKKVQMRQNLIEGGAAKARLQVQRALVPILRDIMWDRRATFVFDKSSVAKSLGDIDVTAMVVRRLDQKISRIKVQLVKAPEDNDD